MKREFPILFAKASTVIATPLLGLVTINYALHLINQRGSEVYPVSVAAFGVTAALSGLCFAVAAVQNSLKNARYAGEKFLHSSLLLIQTVMIAYLKESMSNSAWWMSHATLVAVVNSVFSILLTLLAAAAAWAWYFGFAALNDELWGNWERRIAEINEARASNRAQSPNEAK